MNKTMDKTGWIVSRGSYDDYRVVAIFSEKEKAEAYMKVISALYDDVDAELFYVDPDPPLFL